MLSGKSRTVNVKELLYVKDQRAVYWWMGNFKEVREELYEAAQLSQSV